MRTWTFSDDEIEVRGVSQTSTWKWQDIGQFYERSGSLFLRVKNGSQRILVPLRAFESPSDAARFREFVGEHLAT
jgi:gentisate 1,2-dioxygenase